MIRTYIREKDKFSLSVIEQKESDIVKLVEIFNILLDADIKRKKPNSYPFNKESTPEVTYVWKCLLMNRKDLVKRLVEEPQNDKSTIPLATVNYQMKDSRETVLSKLLALDLKSSENIDIKNEQEREALIQFLMIDCYADPSLKDKNGQDSFHKAEQLAHRNGRADTFTEKYAGSVLDRVASKKAENNVETMIQELNSLKIENAYKEEPPIPPAREEKSRETHGSAESASLDKPDARISADAQNENIEIQV